MKRVVLPVGLIMAYVFVGALLHFLVFPEPKSDPNDRPRSGELATIPGGITFTYRTTASDSAGKFFEAEWKAEPGGGIPTFAYPSQQVTLSVEKGRLHIAADGAEEFLEANAKRVFPPGGEHAWHNPTNFETTGLFRIEPAGMADFVFMQTHRAFGGNASPFEARVLTIVLVGTHGKHAPWIVKALSFAISPTARLFGIKSYYEPVN